MLGLALLLFVLWIVGLLAFKAAGALIHLLLLLAVVVVIYRFVRGRKPVV